MYEWDGTDLGMFLPKLPLDSLGSSSGPFYPNRPAPSFYHPLCVGVEITLDSIGIAFIVAFNATEDEATFIVVFLVVCHSARCLLLRRSLQGRRLEERYLAKRARPTCINSPTRDVRVS